jgi:hypothetical protein
VASGRSAGGRIEAGAGAEADIRPSASEQGAAVPHFSSAFRWTVPGGGTIYRLPAAAAAFIDKRARWDAPQRRPRLRVA